MMKPSNEKGVCEENAIEDKSSTAQFVGSGELTPTGEKTAQSEDHRHHMEEELLLHSVSPSPNSSPGPGGADDGYGTTTSRCSPLTDSVAVNDRTPVGKMIMAGSKGKVSPGVAVADHDNNNIPPFLFGDLSGAVLGQGLYDTVKKEEHSMGDDQFGPNQDTIQIQQRVAQLGRQRQELIEREYEAAAASGGGKKGGVRGQSSPSDFVVVGGDKHGHGAALVPTEMLPPPPPHPPLPGLLEAKRSSDSALQQLHLQLGQHLTNNSNPNIPSNLESLNRNPRHLQMFMERELDYMAAFGGEQKRRRGRNTSKQQHQTAAHNEIRLSDDPHYLGDLLIKNSVDDVARYVFGELDQNDLSKKRAAAAARGDPMTSNKTFKNNKPKKTSVANSSRNKKKHAPLTNEQQPQQRDTGGGDGGGAVDFSPSDKDHRRIAEMPTVVVIDDQPQQKMGFAVAAKDPEKVEPFEKKKQHHVSSTSSSLTMMMGAAGDSAKPTGKTTFTIPIKRIPSKKKTKEGGKEREMVEMTKTAQQTFAAAAGEQRPPVLSVNPVIAIAKEKEHPIPSAGAAASVAKENKQQTSSRQAPAPGGSRSTGGGLRLVNPFLRVPDPEALTRKERLNLWTQPVNVPDAFHKQVTEKFATTHKNSPSTAMHHFRHDWVNRMEEREREAAAPPLTAQPPAENTAAGENREENNDNKAPTEKKNTVVADKGVKGEHGPVVQHQKEEEEQQHVPKGKQKKQQKKKGATAESLEPRKNERIEE